MENDKEIQTESALTEAEISETERLKGEIDFLNAELKSSKEKYIRLYADFDNFRKRAAQDLESANRAGKFEAVRSLLGALDDLERALGFAQAKPEDLIPGIKTVLENFAKNLKGMGVEAVPGVGAAFDPRVHEAIGAVEGEEGRVMHVYQQGFQYGEALVRPARVVVGNGVKEAESSKPNAESN